MTRPPVNDLRERSLRVRILGKMFAAVARHAGTAATADES
jgi:hypothetical protein